MPTSWALSTCLTGGPPVDTGPSFHLLGLVLDKFGTIIPLTRYKQNACDVGASRRWPAFKGCAAGEDSILRAGRDFRGRPGLFPRATLESQGASRDTP